MASIKIVNYATEDYDEVLPIFKSGAYSPITHAIKNNWKRPRVALFLSSALLLIPFSVKYAIMCLLLFWCFHAYCVCRRYDEFYDRCLRTDIKDRQLKFWTTLPNMYFLAKIGGKVVGMVAAQHKDEYRAKLTRMYVDENFRRLGIAKMLTEYLIQILKKRGYKNAIAVTTSPQVGAHRFYETFGFKHSRDFKIGTFLADYFTGVYLIEYIYDLQC